MPRLPSRFTQSEIARALRVAKAEGMTVEIRPDGSIRIVPVELSTRQVDSNAAWVP
jgi:hypothetical protein